MSCGCEIPNILKDFLNSSSLKYSLKRFWEVGVTAIFSKISLYFECFKIIAKTH